MSRAFVDGQLLTTRKEVRAYLLARYSRMGLALSLRTLRRYEKDEFMPLPIRRRDGARKHGPSAAVTTTTIDEWVAARFHLRTVAAAN